MSTGGMGSYIKKTVAGEQYQAYVPPILPFDPPIDFSRLSPLLEKAALSVAKLEGVAERIPNHALFIYMHVRKEALLSSQIEGTQSSFSDLMLFESEQKPSVSLDDVEEVSCYVKAMDHAVSRLQKGFPLSLRLIKETHKMLLSGSRGAHQSPGEFRTSQNWIGGWRPGNALFVPPPPESLADVLANFERFLHDDKLPVLIKAAIAHVQFESIHPFLDGNGRMGRLLIQLLLLEGGMLHRPILYSSLYLKQHRSTYYRLLQEVREVGAWENWVEFFLTAILTSSERAYQTLLAMQDLFEEDEAKLVNHGASVVTVFEYLKRLPQASVPIVAKAVDLSAPSIRQALNTMVDLGILEEVTGKMRDKVYVYQRYLQLLEG